MDRTTKAIVLAIAIALWMDRIESWLRPTPVQAAQWGGIQDPSLTTAQALAAIAAGYCQNKKIC